MNNEQDICKEKQNANRINILKYREAINTKNILKKTQ